VGCDVREASRGIVEREVPLDVEVVETGEDSEEVGESVVEGDEPGWGGGAATGDEVDVTAAVCKDDIVDDDGRICCGWAVGAAVIVGMQV